MANKYLQRRFTVRELILMIFLLAVLFLGLYFWLVFYPIRDRINDLNAQQEELQLRIDVAAARETSYDRMVAEISEIMKTPENERTYMPKYDNVEALTATFSVIFTQMTPSITYGSASETDGVYARSISFAFECENYEKLKKVLTDLTHTPYRSLMTGLSISPSNGSVADDALTVNTTVIFYELA